MRKWMLTWILPTLLYRLHFHWVLLVGNVSLACNDMTPDQLLAASVNCSASPERHTRSYDYMEGGDIRIRKLFCRTQFYLRIDRKGKVKGTANSNCNYCILEIRTVAVGVVAIRGVESDNFLAMNKAGKLYGKKICNDDCNFKELIEENNYNTYASAKWKHHGQSMFIALNPKGKMIQGRKTKKENKSSHFLPMPIS